MRTAIAFLAFLLAVLAAASLGGLVTAPAVRDWYPTLHKPSWTPPARVFGPVWTTLYLAIATAGFLAWRQPAPSGSPGRRVAMLLFSLQLALNAGWSWVFFGLRQPGWAFAEIFLLWASILATTVALYRLSRPAGWLFLPYLLWVTFAAALNFEIWRLNATPTTPAPTPSDTSASPAPTSPPSAPDARKDPNPVPGTKQRCAAALTPMYHNNRQFIPIASTLTLLCLAGCYQTATRAEVEECVQRYTGNSLGAKLVPNGSDTKYNYYLVETFGGNVLERYRIPRRSQLGSDGN